MIADTTKPAPPCDHPRHKVETRVAHLTDTEGGPVTGHTVDIKIRCDVCGIYYRFLGLPIGYMPGRPTVNVDGTELRAAIEPASEGTH